MHTAYRAVRKNKTLFFYQSSSSFIYEMNAKRVRRNEKKTSERSTNDGNNWFLCDSFSCYSVYWLAMYKQIAVALIWRKWNSSTTPNRATTATTTTNRQFVARFFYSIPVLFFFSLAGWKQRATTENVCWKTAETMQCFCVCIRCTFNGKFNHITTHKIDRKYLIPLSNRSKSIFGTVLENEPTHQINNMYHAIGFVILFSFALFGLLLSCPLLHNVVEIATTLCKRFYSVQLRWWWLVAVAFFSQLNCLAIKSLFFRSFCYFRSSFVYCFCTENI